ncbi:hypothetical protein EVAR_6679_1 [Eumeta japonica]|uniref:Uncharacterized protein n=1 Tax=Eumeta variegata TaxID=151549 RepID=A0A4C1TNA5_EUMVA|nr:hypothetical protein EVAR_6679_1 [Eumeta japonica]
MIDEAQRIITKIMKSRNPSSMSITINAIIIAGWRWCGGESVTRHSFFGAGRKCASRQVSEAAVASARASRTGGRPAAAAPRAPAPTDDPAINIATSSRPANYAPVVGAAAAAGAARRAGAGADGAAALRRSGSLSGRKSSFTFGPFQ